MEFFREMDCRLAILRALFGAWEEEVDKNLSRFNQLVNSYRFKWVVGSAEVRKLPSPQPSLKGRGRLSAVRRGLRAGTVLIPLQAAESSSMGQGRRQG